MYKKSLTLHQKSCAKKNNDKLKKKLQKHDEIISNLQNKITMLENNKSNSLSNSLVNNNNSLNNSNCNNSTNTTNNNNNNNNNNNDNSVVNDNSVTTNINININNFGEENVSFIHSKKYLERLLNRPFQGIEQMIADIHFNPNYPENRNIMLPNGKPNSICVKNKNGKLYRNRKEVITNMIDERCDDYKNLCEKYKNELDYYKNRKCKRVTDGLLNNNVKKNEQYHKIVDVFYNFQPKFDYPWAE
jgi:dsDNA-binding SOS-regulon protein